jgi:hypothetical protein
MSATTAAKLDCHPFAKSVRLKKKASKIGVVAQK